MGCLNEPLAEDVFMTEPVSNTTDLDRWTALFEAQGFQFDIEEWPEGRNKPARLVVRLADEDRLRGFSGYGVGFAFTLDGAFLEMGGWA